MTTPHLGSRLLSGSELRSIFGATSLHLRASAKAVDAINVYPVPDGDTGSNMSATLAEAVDRARTLGEPASVSAVLASLARGALYGARGNSGVILAQALRGFANGAGQPEGFDARALADGLAEASRAAYAAVSKPKEGTMLTVLRAAATAAVEAAGVLPGAGRDGPCVGVLATAVAAAEAAEAATIDQLPKLREAGVTDAGGEGICVILRGLIGAIRGVMPAAPPVPDRPIAMLGGHQADTFGFCAEFLIEAGDTPLDLQLLRAMASADGNTSIVVVGDAAASRIHAHTADPDALLRSAESFGQLSRVKVDDMAAQHERFAASGSGARARVAVLTLSRGDGFDAIFRSLGAAVSDLGEVTKPPAGAIAEAADALRAADVIVLPNHKNVVWAAQQAASLARCTVHVVPTETLLQGIAAAIAFQPAEGATANMTGMDAARGTVRSVEVTIAAADRRADGVDAHMGDAIALVDDRLVATGRETMEALIEGLREAGAAEDSLITIYGGLDVTSSELEGARQRVCDAFPGAEVQAMSGGQPLYPYIASVES